MDLCSAMTLIETASSHLCFFYLPRVISLLEQLSTGLSQACFVSSSTERSDGLQSEAAAVSVEEGTVEV